jgi:uncharacterized metal-binding protein
MTWDCAHCDDSTCYQGKDCSDFADEVREAYKDKDLGRLHAVSTAIEGTYYMQKSRLEELIIFARDMGYKRLGIAFCIGFASEARTLADILGREFEVSSVCCKCCAIMKEEYNLKKIRDERVESICNPVGQARALDEDGTELNIVLGLCVGHDCIFYQHSKAPVTTLVVKDRVLGHNPVAALYSRYWKNRIDNEELEMRNDPDSGTSFIPNS